MLKTNCKKARKNILSYIRQYADYLTEYMDIVTETMSDQDMCKNIFQIFKTEKQEDNRNLPEYELFKEWASGLAFGGLFCYHYNRSALKDLGEILEETESEKSRYTEDQAEKMLDNLIYREIVRNA